MPFSPNKINEIVNYLDDDNTTLDFSSHFANNTPPQIPQALIELFALLLSPKIMRSVEFSKQIFK
jgi:hypothetical protein